MLKKLDTKSRCGKISIAKKLHRVRIIPLCKTPVKCNKDGHTIF